MMWSLFIHLSIVQLKDLVSKKIVKKFIELFRCSNYAYYLSIMLILNIAFCPYYIRIILEAFIAIIDTVSVLTYKIFFILCLNYILLHCFCLFQKELEAYKVDNINSVSIEDSEEDEEDY